MTRIDVGLARSNVKLLVSSWKTYMRNLMAWYINKWLEFLWLLILLRLWLMTDLFSYCYERDFMSNIHKSKRQDLVDMFNDTS